MRRSIRAILLLAAIGCSANPGPAGPQPARASVRLLDVSPQIGALVGDVAHVFVTAAYEVPEDGDYHASLMFVTAGGATVSGGKPSWSAPLTEPTGIVELSGHTSELPHELAEPLTAIVMVIGPSRDIAGADTIPGTSAELRARLGLTLPDSSVRSDSIVPGDSAVARIQMRVVRRSAGPVAARSRAIFYNGAGPSSALRGPSLPFEQAIEEYRTYRGEKALALATDERGRRSWGFAFGYADAASAIERALSECRSRVAQREMDADCRIYARGDSIP